MPQAEQIDNRTDGGSWRPASDCRADRFAGRVGAGRVSPNVGAVVARDGEVLGGAFRGELDPGKHAEFIVLERKLPTQLSPARRFSQRLSRVPSATPPSCHASSVYRAPHRSRRDRGARPQRSDPRARGAAIALRGIEIARFDADLMAQIKELNRLFSRLNAGPVGPDRTPEQTADPPESGATGPNGYQVSGRVLDRDRGRTGLTISPSTRIRSRGGSSARHCNRFLTHPGATSEAVEKFP